MANSIMQALADANVKRLRLHRLVISDIRCFDSRCLKSIYVMECGLDGVKFDDAFLMRCRANGTSKIIIRDDWKCGSMQVTEAGIFGFCFSHRNANKKVVLALSPVLVTTTFLRKFLEVGAEVAGRNSLSVHRFSEMERTGLQPPATLSLCGQQNRLQGAGNNRSTRDRALPRLQDQAGRLYPVQLSVVFGVCERARVQWTTAGHHTTARQPAGCVWTIASSAQTFLRR